MNPDALRLFLERNPQYRSRTPQPATFATKYTNLLAGAALTLGKVTVGTSDFLAGRCVLTAATANTDAAWVGGPFLMSLRNQAKSRDMSDIPSEVTALIDDPVNSNMAIGPWVYPVFVKAKGQIFVKVSNPTATPVDVFVVFHGVNLL